MLRAFPTMTLVLSALALPAVGRAAPSEVPTGWRQAARALAVSPDGTLLAAGGDAAEVILYDLAAGRIRLRLSARGAVTALAFSPDGKRLAVGWRGREVDLVDPATGRGQGRLGPLPGWPLGLAFSPDGATLAVCGQAQRIALLPVNGTAGSPRLLSGHTSWVNAVAFSPDGRRIAGAGWDHAVRIWDVATGRLLRSAFGHTFAVNAVTFTRDGQQVISVSDDQSLRVLHARSGAWLRRVPGPAMTCLARAPKADVLVVGTFNGRLIWLSEQQLHGRRIVPAHRTAVLAVAVTPDGRLAATAGRDGRVRIWRWR